MPTIEEQIASAGVDRSRPDWKTKLPRPTAATFQPGTRYYARMKTSKGEMLIRLFPETAPLHVTSFAYLAGLGFYDGLTFHRVIPGFMAQGGCPLGTGTGGPGFKIDGEYDRKVSHDRAGMLSTANAGPGTDGSQFFITFAATPWLDGKHTIFGVVEEGQPVLAALESIGTQSGQPKEPVRIDSVTIEARS